MTAWRRALQPNQKDAEWVRLPQRLSPAYYIIRPLRLACAASAACAAPDFAGYSESEHAAAVDVCLASLEGRLASVEANMATKKDLAELRPASCFSPAR